MGSPSRAALLGADTDVVALRNLIEETRNLPPQRVEESEDYNSLYNPLWYRTKNPGRYDQDMRRAHFLERAQEAGLHRSDNPHVRAIGLEGTPNAIRELRSPREVYGEDWPIYNFGRLIDSPRAMAFATGQMIANKVDPEANPYPNAADDYAKSMNNMLFFMDEPFGKNKNHMRDMQDMRDELAMEPWNMPKEASDMYRAAVRKKYSDRANPKLAKPFLREAGVHRDIGDTATALMGGAMDWATDPFFSPSNSIGGALLDVGLGTLHETLPVGAGAYRKLQERGY